MSRNYPITIDYINEKWKHRPGGSRIARFIVAHDTGNPGSTARQNVNYFNSRNLSASAHAFIDDKDILIMIPLTEKAFHVRYEVSDANDWAIGVELCYGGTINFKEAYNRYVWFMAYLCNRYNMDPKKQIIGHYKLDPQRRTDPINAFVKGGGVTWEKFMNDVAIELKSISKSLPEQPSLTLKQGDKNDRVKKLQTDLKVLGYYKQASDGVYGLATTDAVKSFQRGAKISIDGIFGPESAGALQKALFQLQNNSLLKLGSSGKAVEKIQRLLVTLGFDTGGIDGIFGPKTDRAVRKFQAQRKITVDGIVGPNTRAKLDLAHRESIKKKPVPTPDVVGPVPRVRYRVQVGIFQERKNAENLRDKVVQAGFEAFILEEAIASPFPPIPSTTSITGSSTLTATQLNSYVRSINPKAPLVGLFYIDIANKYGIRGDIAFAQALHETDYFRFTGEVRKEQNNFAGLGATGEGARGASFRTAEEGVRAHIQHLYAYATTKLLPPKEVLVDPRFKYVKRGSANTWVELNGKWAIPGTNYGQSILRVFEGIMYKSYPPKK